MPPKWAKPVEPGGGHAPTPPEESVSVQEIGPIPKSRVAVAKYAMTRVNSIIERLSSIDQGIRRNEYTNHRRIEANTSITFDTGYVAVDLGAPAAGTIWAVHRVVVALSPGPNDNVELVAFPGLYKNRGTSDAYPPPADSIFLPLFIPALIGEVIVSTGVTYDMNHPAVYRGIESLEFIAKINKTISEPCGVYVGLDVEILPELPVQLEVS